MEFRLPDPGEGLLEAEIVEWRVAPGDAVAVNDVLVEIETAKSLVELPCPVDGVVEELLVATGETVAVGTPIIRIAEGSVVAGGRSEAPSPPVTEPVAITTEAEPASGQVISGEVEDVAGKPEALLVGYGARAGSLTRRPRKRPSEVSVPETDQVDESYRTDRPVSRRIDEVTPSGPLHAEPSGESLPGPGQPTGGGEVPRPPLAKPGVRRVARDLGVDLAEVVGTGPGGLITHDDVVAAASHQGRVGASSGSRRVPLKGIRREMFRSMTASLQVPQATAWVEVDVTATMALVESLRARREFAGLRISPLLVFAKAACLAIGRTPEINSSFDVDREEIILHGDVNLGIAAATPRGLVVPNIKRANQLGLLELASELNQLVDIAKKGRVQPSHLAKGTFTITNVGVFGIDAGTPIMNPGEAAIMCLGTVQRRPWVVGTGEKERIEIRSVCTVALTFDHRLADGEMASTFLADVAAILHEPALSLLY